MLVQIVQYVKNNRCVTTKDSDNWIGHPDWPRQGQLSIVCRYLDLNLTAPPFRFSCNTPTMQTLQSLHSFTTLDLGLPIKDFPEHKLYY